MLDFSNIFIGKEYSRPQLSIIWGYRTYNAISRGVVTPKGGEQIILFVTKEKQKHSIQYVDHIIEDILFWEGEEMHRSDKRIMLNNDSIHLFFRQKHNTSFIYKGLLFLRTFKLNKNEPSKFSFSINEINLVDDHIIDRIEKDSNIILTEKTSIILSRVGQGSYRQGVIQLWKKCCLTGFEYLDVLIASHIKPWKTSSNDERLNPLNSLLLVPTLDKLFDRGLIAFQPSGQIILSEKIIKNDWDSINVNNSMKLKNVSESTKVFLEYHHQYIYNTNEVI